VNVADVNDNVPVFPLSQYIVQGIAETVAVGTDIIQGPSALQSERHTGTLFSVYIGCALHLAVVFMLFSVFFVCGGKGVGLMLEQSFCL